jgi:hypothetical protein
VHDSWLQLVGVVLRPVRPHLEACLRERERYLTAERRLAERRVLALEDCQARIESLRATVFEANDGVVTSRMTELEREWRALSRSDLDGRLMDLWARVAPHPWIDRKLWRDSDPAEQLDAAIALAADAEGIDTAERAIGSLRAALAPWGIRIGSRIRWRSFESDFDRMVALLAEPLHAANEALSARGMESVVFDRARRLGRAVYEAAEARFPERPALVRSLAHAAFVDGVFGAASPLRRPNPVTAMREFWGAGYVFSAIDTSGVTVEIPRLFTPVTATERQDAALSVGRKV